MTEPTERLQAIIEDADRCVKCAVCLPHCPTYRVSGNEAESPRGRIALMRGLADGTLPLSAGLERHLDQCLTCRSCEPVCPAGVRYGRLLDNARAEQAARHTPAWRKRAGLALLTRRRLLRALTRLARMGRALGLARVMPALRLLPRHRDARPRRTHYPAAASPERRVGLFLGCVADPLDAETRDSAAEVLNACGYQVAVPREQTCCGALHQHSGFDEAARSLAEANRRAFDAERVEAVISSATGCGAQLGEHVFPESHRDICRWLLEEGRVGKLSLEPLETTVAVHVPCTQRNVLDGADAARELVAHVPGVRVETLPEDPKCCGAAGTYMLEHPAIADRLGAQQAGAIARVDPAIVVTANVGCALHLTDHLDRLGCGAEVIHPVTLIARQLRIEG